MPVSGRKFLKLSGGRGEPFVAGVFSERGRFKKNFAGQLLLQPAKGLDFCGNHSGGMLPPSVREAEK